MASVGSTKQDDPSDSAKVESADAEVSGPPQAPPTPGSAAPPAPRTSSPVGTATATATAAATGTTATAAAATAATTKTTKAAQPPPAAAPPPPPPPPTSPTASTAYPAESSFSFGGGLGGLLAASTGSESTLVDLGEGWARRCLRDTALVREGLVLVVESAALPTSKLGELKVLPEERSKALAAICREALVTASDESSAPPLGTLAVLPAAVAKNFLTRLRLLFSAAFGVLVTALAAGAGAAVGVGDGGPDDGPAREDGFDGSSVMAFLAWLPLVASLALRPARLAATTAGCAALEALVREARLTNDAARRLSGQLSELLAQENGAPTQEATSANVAHRVARLTRSKDASDQSAKVLKGEIDKLLRTLLLPRLRDVSPTVRRMALQSLAKLVQEDGEVYAQSPWPERLLSMVRDPHPEVRQAAIEAAMDWYSAPEVPEAKPPTPKRRRGNAGEALTTAGSSLGDQSSDPMPEIFTKLAPHVAVLLAERAKDSEPRVAAAAVRALRSSVLASHLSDAAFAAVAELCLGAPETFVAQRGEAALFMDQHLLVEPGLGAARADMIARGVLDATAQHDAVGGHFGAEQGLVLLSNFLAHYAPASRLPLAGRLVSSLWGRTPCLTRWTSMADLCLVGEDGGASGGMPTLAAPQRLALLYVLEASVHLASHNGGPTLAEAAVALSPRLPRLLDFGVSEPAALLPVASIVKLLVDHACGTGGADTSEASGYVALPRALVPSLQRCLKGGSDQPQLHPVASLALADALLSLAERSREAQSVAIQLVVELRKVLEKSLLVLLAPPKVRANDKGPHDPKLASAVETISSSASSLASLCSRGVDVVGVAPAVGGRFLSTILLLVDLSTQDEAAAKLSFTLLDLAVPLLILRRQQAAVAPPTSTATSAIAGRASASLPRRSLPAEKLTTEEYQGLPKVTEDFQKSCCKLAASSSNLCRPPLRCHAICSYLALLEAEPTLKTTSEQLQSIAVGLKRLFGAASNVPTPILEAGLRVAVAAGGLSSASSVVSEAVGARQELAVASRWLVQSAIAEGSTPDDGAEQNFAEQQKRCNEEAAVAALVAARAVSESTSEAVYAGPPGQMLVSQLTSLPESSPIGQAVKGLLNRLRHFAVISRDEAKKYYSIQFNAILMGLSTCDRSTASRLSDILAYQASAPGPSPTLSPSHSSSSNKKFENVSKGFSNIWTPPPPGSAAAARLSAGLVEALREVVSAALQRNRTLGSLLLPWVSAGPSNGACALAPSAARALARELASNATIAAHERALLSALQARGSAVVIQQLRRGKSKQGKLLALAVKRKTAQLKMAAKKAQNSSSGAAAPAAPTAWLQKRGADNVQAGAAPGAGLGDSTGSWIQRKPMGSTELTIKERRKRKGSKGLQPRGRSTAASATAMAAAVAAVGGVGEEGGEVGGGGAKKAPPVVGRVRTTVKRPSPSRPEGANDNDDNNNNNNDNINVDGAVQQKRRGTGGEELERSGAKRRATMANRSAVGREVTPDAPRPVPIVIRSGGGIALRSAAAQAQAPIGVAAAEGAPGEASGGQNGPAPEVPPRLFGGFPPVGQPSEQLFPRTSAGGPRAQDDAAAEEEAPAAAAPPPPAPRQWRLRASGV